MAAGANAEAPVPRFSVPEVDPTLAGRDCVDRALVLVVVQSRFAHAGLEVAAGDLRGTLDADAAVERRDEVGNAPDGLKDVEDDLFDVLAPEGGGGRGGPADHVV